MKVNSRSRLDELAWEFFKIFACAEYSLKRASFLVNKHRAEANWDDFANKIHDCVTSELKRPSPHAERYRSAKSFMLEHPPKIQINRGGELEWEDLEEIAGNETLILLKYVRRVRNNLFHGGKFNAVWFAPERSEMLMTHSITILQFCIKINENVNQAYLGRQEM
jgi:hypothetical protein